MSLGSLLYKFTSVIVEVEPVFSKAAVWIPLKLRFTLGLVSAKRLPVMAYGCGEVLLSLRLSNEGMD